MLVATRGFAHLRTGRATSASNWSVEERHSAAEREKLELDPLGSEAPAGGACLHEIKYDGDRMHARIDGDQATLLSCLQAGAIIKGP